jgi:hypothetical protein
MSCSVILFPYHPQTWSGRPTWLKVLPLGRRFTTRLVKASSSPGFACDYSHANGQLVLRLKTLKHVVLKLLFDVICDEPVASLQQQNLVLFTDKTNFAEPGIKDFLAKPLRQTDATLRAAQDAAGRFF